MPVITKRSPRLSFEFVAARKQSTLGGLPAEEALAQQFDLWKKLRALPGLDPRVRTTHGYSPERIVGQLLYALGSNCIPDAQPHKISVPNALPQRPQFLAKDSGPIHAHDKQVDTFWNWCSICFTDSEIAS
jgi:hypothetical protein